MYSTISICKLVATLLLATPRVDTIDANFPANLAPQVFLLNDDLIDYIGYQLVHTYSFGAWDFPTDCNSDAADPYTRVAARVLIGYIMAEDAVVQIERFNLNVCRDVVLDRKEIHNQILLGIATLIAWETQGCAKEPLHIGIVSAALSTAWWWLNERGISDRECQAFGFSPDDLPPAIERCADYLCSLSVADNSPWGHVYPDGGKTFNVPALPGFVWVPWEAG